MKRLIATSPAVLGGIAAVTLVAGAGAALAAWRVQSDEVVLTAETATLSPGNKPLVSAEGNAVTVSWTPNTFGERKVDSYRIKRYDLGGAAQQPHGTCEENVAKETCTDAGVPAGSWRYTVVPVKGGWTGPESAKSDAVIVAADGKAVVVPESAADKPAGPAAGPAVVQVGDPATPGEPGKPGAAPTWTVQPGADGVLGTADTLTYAGGAPVEPGTIIKGWSGGQRPVVLVARAGAQPVVTVDDGDTRVFGPLAVPPATVPADVAYDATLAAVQGRIVVTLGAVRKPPAPQEESTTPNQPGTPVESAPGAPETPGTETAAPTTPGSTPGTTESATTEPTPGNTTGETNGGGTAGSEPEGEPETPTTDTSGPLDPDVTPSATTPTVEPVLVLVAGP
ncbi:hypothetical protein [Asanoa sp. NPDC050611]|uniref:hypothetical protein n=1 Tax=Asanoa sp. NPDC050611 TaxID=3157098 RepID=UPI003401A836